MGYSTTKVVGFLSHRSMLKSDHCGIESYSFFGLLSAAWC